jgi:hypothetical protein
MTTSVWKPDWYALHPYQPETIEALPNELLDTAHRFVPKGEQVLSIFVVPTNPYLSRKKKHRIAPTQALIFTSTGVLHIQVPTASENAHQPTFLHAKDLLYVHLSLILLYDRLEMIGQVNGRLEKIEVEYNAVGRRLLEPALQQFLSKSWENTELLSTDSHTEEIAAQSLNGLPTKYRNGLKNFALQPKENLLGVIFQPPILEKLWMGFSRQIAPTTMLALTDRQVINCCETKTDEPNSYGWAFTFLSIKTIDKIEVIPFGNHQLLTFHLAREGGQSQLDFQLTQSNVLDWQALWDRYRNTSPIIKIVGR